MTGADDHAVNAMGKDHGDRAGYRTLGCVVDGSEEESGGVTGCGGGANAG